MGNLINIDLGKLLRYTQTYRYKVLTKIDSDFEFFEEEKTLEKFNHHWQAVMYLKDLYDRSQKNDDNVIVNYHIHSPPYFFVIESKKENTFAKRYYVEKCGYF